jgi:hypothetical protein
MTSTVRRLEAPWTIEEGPSTFTVRTANGFVISVTWFDEDPNREFNLRKEEARRVAVAIARLPDLIAMETAAESVDDEYGTDYDDE